MKLQNQLNKQGRLFEPRKSERITYRQPKRVDGRIIYQQPRREGK